VVNARSSYRYDEIMWDHKFLPAFRSDEDGRLVLDLTRIDAADRTSG